jgi:hypothetical protein
MSTCDNTVPSGVDAAIGAGVLGAVLHSHTVGLCPTFPT